ncbi:conserved protein of unknown function(with TPR domain) [Magnetospirillum gryphiswaldense MSR-1 v2]|uniref:TPR repeat n=2 Tax=Magnetospirillum gryphiswaldense TaxID=55518 RepID=V6F7F2_MAGGM|nr:conserved protein of unknown function(with TPR domain) [Magnetospirillum gryphiswaldense MSR-1 v2]
MPTSERIERFHAEHALLMGHAALLNERPDQALDWFERLCALNDSSEGWLHQGVALLRLGRMDQARKAFRHCLSRGEQPWAEYARQAEGGAAQDVQAHFPAMFLHSVYELAMDHFRREEFTQCLAMLSTFTTDNGEMPNILSLSAQTCLRLERPQQALALAARAAELRPEVARYHAITATAALAADRLDLALKYAREAVAIQPDLHYALSTLATVLRHMGQTQEALRVMDNALYIHPDDPVLLKQRALIQAMGQGASVIDNHAPPHDPQQTSPS